MGSAATRTREAKAGWKRLCLWPRGVIGNETGEEDEIRVVWAISPRLTDSWKPLSIGTTTP